jgi:hypothetical protein
MLGRITHRYHRGSVLPRIASVAVAGGGAQLLAARASGKDVALGILAGLGAAFSLWAAIWGQLDLSRAIQSGCSAVIGFGAAASFLRSYRQRSRLHHAALCVRPWPIRLGEPVTATLHVVVEGGVADVAASVSCTEHVVGRQGKYATTRTSSLYSEQLPAEHDWRFTLPDGGLPSLSVESNVIQWQLNTVVRDGEADIPVSFPLLVLPEVIS